MKLCSLKRRLASMVYEALLLAALLFVAGFVVVGLQPGQPGGMPKAVFQLYLFVVTGSYFVWFWRHGGQTLAMKTWRIRLVAAAGGPVGLAQSWRRYVLAVLGLFACGIGFLWALWDRDRQFLHDRLAGTRLIMKEG